MRKKNTIDHLETILGFLWSFCMIAGCSYLVFFQGANAWWYVLFIILAAGWKTDYRKELELYYENKTP